MGQTISVKYFARRNRPTSDGLIPIYMRIRIGSKRLSIPTKIQVPGHCWNGEKVTGVNDESRKLNQCLNGFTLRAFDLQRELMEEGRSITIENMRCKWHGVSLERPRMLMEIFAHHNQQMKELIDHEFSPLTFERYETSYRHTQGFLRWKFHIDDIDIKELKFEFIADYEFWLKTIRKCSHNTAVKYLSNFKKIIHICRNNGWIPNDPFVGFKMAKREIDKSFLTQHELDIIMQKEFETERISEVRDVFIFCCFTGLSYVDVEQLAHDDITIGIDGERWISTKRQKTDTPTRIPLLPVAIEIMEKYKYYASRIRPNKIMPVGSNQKMNTYLKEIANTCGIKKKITFHIARHTFATTVTLSNGVPIETVGKMLGHKNLKTTQHYAKILDKKVSEDMAMLKVKYQARLPNDDCEKFSVISS
jgi:integrase